MSGKSFAGATEGLAVEDKALLLVCLIADEDSEVQAAYWEKFGVAAFKHSIQKLKSGNSDDDYLMGFYLYNKYLGEFLYYK